MTERFTARSGMYLEGNLLRYPNGTVWCNTNSAQASALIEYGRHLERTERNAELGRWRSKKHPDYVVYPEGDSVWVRVLNERTGDVCWTKGANKQMESEVAREYFDVQEPPKPWLSAVHGEAWVIVFEGKERVAVVDDGYFVWSGGDDGYPLDYERITAGRRIWPEPEEADEWERGSA